MLLLDTRVEQAIFRGAYVTLCYARAARDAQFTMRAQWR